MRKSENLTKLAGALSKAQAEMPPAQLNATNPFLKNQYATLGSIIETAKPVLDKYGLSVAQSTTSNNGDVGVTTLLLHESGEWLEDTVFLPLGDEKGKSQAQVAGSIVSYLRRYSYAAMLGIYAEEDVDGHLPIKKEQTKAQSKPEPKPAPMNGTRPYSPEVVRKKIHERAEKHKEFTPNDAQFNLLRYGLELCFIDDPAVEDKRHTVLNYLTGSTSTKDVDGQMFKAIVEDWLEMTKDDGGEYTVNNLAAVEAKEIYGVALKEEGQQELAI